jgi:ribosomal protein S18 acetylase RimI-like enzyme
MIAIEPITLDNLAAFKAVRLRALLDTPSAFGSTYAREVAMTDAEWSLRVERWSGERGIGLLAVDGNEPCGIAGALVDEKDATHGQLVSMWTDPAFRRRGVGRMLVEAIIAWAEQAGLRRLDLFVTSNNERATRFYGGLGFTMTSRSIPYVNDPALLEFEMTRAIP